MAIEITERTYRLTGLSTILGTQPANRQLHHDYILSKCPEGKKEANRIMDYDEEEARALTVFPRDPDDAPVLLAYQVAGYLKEALEALKVTNNIANPKSKVDDFLFVDPDQIYFYRNGEMITKPEPDRLERPLRTEYRGTEMNVLASSEVINTPWDIELTLRLLPNKKASSRSAYAELTWEAVEDALSYGQYKGLGQWRNAGHGRFTWARVD